MHPSRPPPKPRQVKTKPPVSPDDTPRLPHERDESADSQHVVGEREDMQQAHDDLEKGLVDTDLRGTPGVEAAAGAQGRQAVDVQAEVARTRGRNTRKPEENKK